MNLLVRYNFVLLSCVVLVVFATDYCRQGLCPTGTKHIGCNNTGLFALSCPKGVILTNLTNYKPSILNLHNNIRNKTAAGLVTNHMSAVRMASVTWDNELEYLAILNVKRCWSGDECRNTDTFKNVSQFTTSIFEGTTPISDKNKLITLVIDGMIRQSAKSNMTLINSYHFDLYTSHWAMLVSESTVKLGCAMIEYQRSDGAYEKRFTCNYSSMNIEGQRVYEAGPTASKCKTGRHYHWTALCSFYERYS